MIILRKFSSKSFLGIPLTTAEKEGIFYHQFVFKGNINSALLSQIRLFDSKRLMNRIGRVSKNDFQHIKEKTIALIDNRDS